MFNSVNSAIYNNNFAHTNKVSGTKGALTLFNFSFFTDTAFSITPYFRNYIFSRREAGFGSVSPLFSYRYSSKSSKWRLRYFRTWMVMGSLRKHNSVRRALSRISLFNLGYTSLAMFHRFHRTLSNPYTSKWSVAPQFNTKFGLMRIWFSRILHSRISSGLAAVGLLRRLFFKAWSLVLYCFGGLMSSYAKVLYTRLAFNLPYRFSALGFDSGVFNSLGAKRVVYGAWHSPYAKQTKFYKRKRLMITRYARMLFDVRRTRFVKKICQSVPHSAINRVQTFSVMFHTRLVTFVSIFFNINSHMRTLMLIKLGHLFVNGQCVRNPNFSLSTHDTVSFSHIALAWLRALRGQRKHVFPFIRSKVRRKFLGNWRPRVFRRGFEKAIIFGPFKQFAVIRHTSMLPVRPFRRKLDSNPFFSNTRIRFLLGTLSF